LSWRGALPLFRLRAPSITPIRVVKMAPMKMMSVHVQYYKELVHIARSITDEAASKIDHTLERMDQELVRKNISHYHALLDFYCRRRDYDKISHYFNTIQEKQILDTHTFNLIISLLAAEGEEVRLFETVESMLKAKIKPNIFTATPIIRYLIRRDNGIEESLKWLDRLRGEGCKIDLILWTSIVDRAACKSNKLAEECYQVAVEKDGIRPDEYFITAYLRRYAKCGDIASFKRWLDIAKDNGVKLVQVSFNSPLILSASTKHWEAMLEIYILMISAYFKPTPDALSRVMNNLQRLDVQPKPILDWMRKVEQIEGHIDQDFYEVILLLFTSNNKPEAFDEVWEAMRERVEGASESFLVYTIDTLRKSGREAEARAFINEKLNRNEKKHFRVDCRRRDIEQVRIQKQLALQSAEIAKLSTSAEQPIVKTDKKSESLKAKKTYFEFLMWRQGRMLAKSREDVRKGVDYRYSTAGLLKVSK